MAVCKVKRGELDENGYANCNCCGKKKMLPDLELCMECEKFSCIKTCVKYRKQFPYGYICLKCYEKTKRKQI